MKKTSQQYSFYNFFASEWLLIVPTYAQSDSNRLSKVANTPKYAQPPKSLVEYPGVIDGQIFLLFDV